MYLFNLLKLVEHKLKIVKECLLIKNFYCKKKYMEKNNVVICFIQSINVIERCKYTLAFFENFIQFHAVNYKLFLI